ncbi:DUF2334 domain-containing protein, partial [Chromatiaceae bacterium AAb-1]|nr:DUF2334 domain-containing protein [Chromatiaceae bacterium AAb-1]
MKISIRDDDPNYFTAFADLQQAYGRFFGVLPVTFAVIPFVCDSYHRMLSIEGPSRKERLQKQTEMVLALSAAEFADTQRHYPVGDNHELVAGLNSMITSGTGEVGLHGYNHRYYDDGAEFIKNHVNFFNVRDGLHYLNILFGDTVTSFVP